MIFVTAVNPVFSDSTGQNIDIIATFESLGEVPFTAASYDVELHGREIYARALAGEFGPVGAYNPTV